MPQAGKVGADQADGAALWPRAAIAEACREVALGVGACIWRTGRLAQQRLRCCIKSRGRLSILHGFDKMTVESLLDHICGNMVHPWYS